MPRAATPERDKMVSLRAPTPEWDLIDRAAAAGKSRTAFVLDAAKRQAEDTLKERATVAFTAEEWRGLAKLLDAPVSASEQKKVARLLAERPAWEQT